MKLRLNTMGKALLREYKDKHYDWVIRMVFHTLQSMAGRIMFIEFPENYCLQYRDSKLVDMADLSAVTSKLRIEIEAAYAVLVDLLSPGRFKGPDDMHIAGVLCLLEQVEVELSRSESVISDILVDPQDFMDELAVCIYLLKFHIELFTVSDEDIQ